MPSPFHSPPDAKLTTLFPLIHREHRLMRSPSPCHPASRTLTPSTSLFFSLSLAIMKEVLLISKRIFYLADCILTCLPGGQLSPLPPYVASAAPFLWRHSSAFVNALLAAIFKRHYFSIPVVLSAGYSLESTGELSKLYHAQDVPGNN